MVLTLVRTVAFAVHLVADLRLTDRDSLVVSVVLRLMGRGRRIRALRLLLVCRAALGVHRRGHGG